MKLSVDGDTGNTKLSIGPLGQLLTLETSGGGGGIGGGGKGGEGSPKGDEDSDSAPPQLEKEKGASGVDLPDPPQLGTAPSSLPTTSQLIRWVHEDGLQPPSTHVAHG